MFNPGIFNILRPSVRTRLRAATVSSEILAARVSSLDLFKKCLLSTSSPTKVFDLNFFADLLRNLLVVIRTQALILALIFRYIVRVSLTYELATHKFVMCRPFGKRLDYWKGQLQNLRNTDSQSSNRKYQVNRVNIRCEKYNFIHMTKPISIILFPVGNAKGN